MAINLGQITTTQWFILFLLIVLLSLVLYYLVRNFEIDEITLGSPWVKLKKKHVTSANRNESKKINASSSSSKNSIHRLEPQNVGQDRKEVDNTIIVSREILEMAEANLAILETQAAGYTKLTIPAHLQLQLDDQREKVLALKRSMEPK